jgi:TolB-like protein
MPHDIFISYSSRDREKAQALIAELRAGGYDVWIDQGGIDGAMDWSSEIVQAINDCSTIIFLISSHSAASHNCAKEIHLASEKQKNILPVVVESVQLPVIFEYPLAGLQKLRIEDRKGITNTLEKLRSGKTALAAMQTLSASAVEADGKLRLAILPFHDLSPAKDNEWFADGMMDELISTLGSLAHLKVPPRSDVMYYKENRPKAVEIAADLRVRYFVEGSVMKAGEKIRINATLIDATKNEQIWSNKYTGTFDDIFDFQEQTAKAITEALRITLSPEEEQKIEKKPTENAEAYELYLKGLQYFRRHTKADFERAIELLEEAISLDNDFALALRQLGIAAIEYYTHYSREKKWVELAERCASSLERADGNSKQLLNLRSIIAHHLHDGQKALEYALRSVEIDPNYASGWDAVGWAYQELGMLGEAAKAREEDVRLRPNDFSSQHAYLLALNEAGALDEAREAALRAMPVFERHLRFERDDASTRAKYIFILGMAREHERALEEADKLLAQGTLDGLSFYNLACFFMNEHLPEKAMPILRLSFEKGYNDVEYTRRDPDLFGLHGTPEFEALMKEMGEKTAEETNA